VVVLLAALIGKTEIISMDKLLKGVTDPTTWAPTQHAI
jgi:hypothetical protein